MEGIQEFASDMLVPIENILTPTSAGTENMMVNMADIEIDRQDVTTNHMLNDIPFKKAAGIRDMNDIAGKEKSLLALYGTYKNITKADNVSDIMRGLQKKNWFLSRHKDTTKDFYVKTKV